MFCTGTMGELAAVTKVDGRTIGSGQPGPMTRRLSELFAERTRDGRRASDIDACHRVSTVTAMTTGAVRSSPLTSSILVSGSARSTGTDR